MCAVMSYTSAAFAPSNAAVNVLAKYASQYDLDAARYGNPKLEAMRYSQLTTEVDVAMGLYYQLHDLGERPHAFQGV